MKLKTRLAVAFMIITIVPMLLIFVSFFAINDHQARSLDVYKRQDRSR